MTVGEELAIEREKKGMGLRPAAAEIGCAVSALEAWEKGMRIPTIKWAPALARFMDQPEPEIRERLLREMGWLQEGDIFVPAAPTGPLPRAGRKAPTRAKAASKTRRPKPLTRSLPFSTVTELVAA